MKNSRNRDYTDSTDRTDSDSIHLILIFRFLSSICENLCNLWTLLLLSVVTGVAFGQGAPTYAKDIRPVLQARCVVCHSQANIGNAIISGGLALDSYAALKKGVVGKAGARAIFTAGK